MRYFIVFYRLADNSNTNDFLNIQLWGYPSYESVLNRIEQDEEPEQRSDIIVTNIIELNETDYKDWVK